MRLINVKTRKLGSFHQNLPKYAILSHRWTDKELEFDDASKLFKIWPPVVSVKLKTMGSNIFGAILVVSKSQTRSNSARL